MELDRGSTEGLACGDEQCERECGDAHCFYERHDEV